MVFLVDGREAAQVRGVVWGGVVVGRGGLITTIATNKALRQPCPNPVPDCFPRPQHDPEAVEKLEKAQGAGAEEKVAWGEVGAAEKALSEAEKASSVLQGRRKEFRVLWWGGRCGEGE